MQSHGLIFDLCSKCLRKWKAVVPGRSVVRPRWPLSSWANRKIWPHGHGWPLRHIWPHWCVWHDRGVGLGTGRSGAFTWRADAVTWSAGWSRPLRRHNMVVVCTWRPGSRLMHALWHHHCASRQAIWHLSLCFQHLLMLGHALGWTHCLKPAQDVLKHMGIQYYKKHVTVVIMLLSHTCWNEHLKKVKG